LCAPTSADGKAQLVYYEIGVNGFYGGVFGKGLSENIRLAYEWLVENYNDGDEIFIFGFSRGVTLACRSASAPFPTSGFRFQGESCRRWPPRSRTAFSSGCHYHARLRKIGSPRLFT
jgi:Uncharacterized alpha/beta hydrolase domain (DUF2235)